MPRTNCAACQWSSRPSSDGAFGKFDRQQLQRGFQVFKEVCASCHGLRLVAFRNLSGQLGRRSREIHLPRYRREQPEDTLAFRRVLRTFQRHLPKNDHPHIRGMLPSSKSPDSEPIGSIRSSHTMELLCARH